MYLRNLDEYNKYTSEINGRQKLLRIVLFTLVIIIALLASSLTESESAPLLNKDSLISERTAEAMAKVNKTN